MANIFNNDNLVEADELCRYLVKNGITEAKLDSLASVVIKLDTNEEMGFNKLNKIIKLVQDANNELRDMYVLGCFNVELDFANSEIYICEAEY